MSNADASGDIVLYAADAPIVNGGWRRQADSTAAGGFSLRHPNANAAKLSGALASPVSLSERRAYEGTCCWFCYDEGWHWLPSAAIMGP